MSRITFDAVTNRRARIEGTRPERGYIVMKKYLIVALVLLAGCATTWQKAGGTFTAADYSLAMPEGWMMHAEQKSLHASKDGVSLQNIWVVVMPLSEQRSDAKKTLKKGMLPEEVAEVIVDGLQSDQSLSQFMVAENVPVKIGGVEGFRLVYTFKRKKLQYKSVYYGLLHGEKFYRLTYSAPVLYYFEKDVAAFEKIVQSFALPGKGS